MSSNSQSVTLNSRDVTLDDESDSSTVAVHDNCDINLNFKNHICHKHTYNDAERRIKKKS